MIITTTMLNNLENQLETPPTIGGTVVLNYNAITEIADFTYNDLINYLINQHICPIVKITNSVYHDGNDVLMYTFNCIDYLSNNTVYFQNDFPISANSANSYNWSIERDQVN